MISKPVLRFILGGAALAMFFACVVFFPSTPDQTTTHPAPATDDDAAALAHSALMAEVWEEDLSDAFDAEEVDQNTATARTVPRHNINRMFLIADPENGITPPPERQK